MRCLAQSNTTVSVAGVEPWKWQLPPSLANVTPLQDGKTGRDLLGEQLDLLLGAVQDIMRDAAQAGSQHLLAHQRFLKDRFAKPRDELKL